LNPQQQEQEATGQTNRAEEGEPKNEGKEPGYTTGRQSGEKEHAEQDAIKGGSSMGKQLEEKDGEQSRKTGCFPRVITVTFNPFSFKSKSKIRKHQ